jgi:hypothetical protein
MHGFRKWLKAITFVFSWWGVNMYAQQSPFMRISLQMPHANLESVFDSIVNKTGYFFSYDPTSINVKRKVNVQSNQMPLNELLMQILSSDSLNITFAQKHIILSHPAMRRNVSLEYRGRVVEAGTNNPIEYANVVVKSHTIGTITNARGEFVLKVPADLGGEPLIVSFIGYIPELIQPVPEVEHTIALTLAPNMLKEITIKVTNPLELLNKAFENIQDNCSSKPLSLTGFYRETSRKNNDYIAITEAVLNVWKPACNSYRPDRVRLLKGRKSLDVKQMDTVAYKFQGGITSDLYLDAAKNRPSFADPEFEDFYTYKLDEIQQVGNDRLYVISFDQKKEFDFPFYKGRIYLDANSLAIVAIEFSLSPIGIKNATKTFVLKSPRHFKVKAESAHYRVSYRKFGNHWYLNHVRSEIEVSVRKRNHLFGNNYRTVAEMVVTNFDTIQNKLVNEGLPIRSSDIITEKSFPYDPLFWGEENMIVPDEPIENAIRRISNKLQGLKSCN